MDLAKFEALQAERFGNVHDAACRMCGQWCGGACGGCYFGPGLAGTERAYTRHIRRGEDCDVCRSAHARRRAEERIPAQRAAAEDRRRRRKAAERAAQKRLMADRDVAVQFGMLLDEELRKRGVR